MPETANHKPSIVIPATAGTSDFRFWNAAAKALDSRFRGNDDVS